MRKLKITKIELADHDRVDSLREYVDRVLEALGHPEALVTDESQVRDFPSDESRLRQIAKKLGFAVDKKDHIWQLAERYKARRLSN